MVYLFFIGVIMMMKGEEKIWIRTRLF